MTRIRLVAACVLFLSVAASAQTPVIVLTKALSGFSAPTYITNAHDGTNRRFVVEQGGRIFVSQPGSSTSSVFLDIRTLVLSSGEQGLLGLAFHPQYSTNRKFFVNYTQQPNGATVIAQYLVSSNPNVADPTSALVILTIAQPYINHNGGMIEFGADGYLYIGMGDGGSHNDPQNHAQNIDDLLGKILRIDIDHPTSPTMPYSSPATNPFFGSIPGRDEIYAVGMRNPWRFSFDRSTQLLYAADVGEGMWEEIDIIDLGGNYGWRIYEGNHCTGLDPCGGPGFTFPIAEYSHSTGRCSIIGGYVYRGAAKALPLGAYIYGDLCTGEVLMLMNGVQTVLLDTAYRIVSFGEDEAGELYLVAYDGTIYNIKRKFSAQTTSI